MLYFIALGLIVLILGIVFYIPKIHPPAQIGGTSVATDTPYLYPTRDKLRKMFDHQVPYKTKNGSWLSVSFKNMKRFNKDGIWHTLRETKNDVEAGKLYPQTYILPNDLNKVMITSGNNSFILKKVNSWARQGLKIVDSKKEVMENSKEYDLAQILIPNPHLINGYKYDLRMFLVVHYRHGIMLMKESYFSYSNKKYNPKSSDMFARIGGVHLTPEFYRSNKLPERSSDYKLYPVIYPKITNVLKEIFDLYPRPLLTDAEKKAELIKIFGIDVNVFVDKGKLRPMLIEMNSNPSLLFPEADWKNKLIYEMVTSLEKDDIGKFTILRA
jgi:hypothetical protein